MKALPLITRLIFLSGLKGISAHDLLTDAVSNPQESQNFESAVVTAVMTPPDDKFKESILEGTKCIENSSCEDCDQAKGCHWCSHDNSCHAVGSVHGCAWGASCGDKKHSHKEDSGCSAYTSCRECGSSRLCHWCGHDNACHKQGSPYGCLSGVDCYSNDRCLRKEPEPIENAPFTAMGFMPLVVVIALGSCLICCITSCFCVATGVKGAYNDLLSAADRRSPLSLSESESAEQDTAVATSLSEPLLAQQSPQQEEAEIDEEENNTETETVEETGAAEPIESEVVDPETPETDPEPCQETDSEPTDNTRTTQPSSTQTSGYVHLSDMINSNANGQNAPPRRSIRARRPRHMQRLYNSCTACYAFFMLIIAGIMFTALRFYPQVPVYNICNDAVAWKSIIDNFASKHPAADIEILGSILNPNHIDVALDVGKGSFYHNEAFVGTFDIPPVTVKGMSITDFLIIAHLSPDKWDALSLSKEYYEGHLVLHVDTQLTIRVPMLANYQLSTEANGMEVRVNELADRSLCACPTWDEPNKTTPLLFA